jgi:hypothetical protein
MKRPLKFPLKFEKGIREITRKRTTKEAVKAFEVFYLFKVREGQVVKWGRVDEALAQKLLRENMEGFREKGFEEEWWFEMARCDYAKMKRRVPRKKVKKEFDANGVPKVTKTPLDPQVSALLGYVKVTKSG